MEKFLNHSKAIILLDVNYAFLSEEPFKSNSHKFNFWYVDKFVKIEDALTEQDLSIAPDLATIAMKCLGIGPEYSAYVKDSIIYTVIYYHRSETFYGASGGWGTITLHTTSDDYIDPFSHEFAHAIGTAPWSTDRPAAWVHDEYLESFSGDLNWRNWTNLVLTEDILSPVIKYWLKEAEYFNLFWGTFEECQSPKNTFWYDLIGNGCGADGVIDCCTNNPHEWGQQRDCALCPTCEENKMYWKEIGCFSVSTLKQGEKGLFTSTLASVMEGRHSIDVNSLNFFGQVNERIICKRIEQITGSADGICKNLCMEICSDGKKMHRRKMY